MTMLCKLQYMSFISWFYVSAEYERSGLNLKLKKKKKKNKLGKMGMNVGKVKVGGANVGHKLANKFLTNSVSSKNSKKIFKTNSHKIPAYKSIIKTYSSSGSSYGNGRGGSSYSSGGSRGGGRRG